MLLPKKWALSFGLLAAIPTVSVAGPFDFVKSGDKQEQASTPADSEEKHVNQRVAEDIATALKRANLVHRNVAIQFESGTATISGEIKDEAQLAVVTRIVGRIDGVQTVNNQLIPMSDAPADSPVQQASAQQPGTPSRDVQPVSYNQAKPRSNQEVAQNIANALSQVGLSGYDIEIRYKDGAASLIGNVESADQAMRAVHSARMVPGVNQVLNKLTVAGQPAQQSQGGSPYYGPQGPQIQQMQGYGQAPPQQQWQQGPPPQMYPTGGPQGPQGAPMQGYPPNPAHVQQMGHQMYNQPNMPDHAWPAYAQYDNYSAVTYPSQYDASAWPYIGPYYPYPQVPLGWRKSSLEWEDGSWNLQFDSRTDRWWWFMNPKNW